MEEGTTQMRRINCLRWALVIAVLWPAALCAQGRAVEPSATKTSGSSDLLEFTFLNDWENAVLNGDRGKLTALYTTIPPAQARTPQGNSQDTSEEPAFWSALSAKGLASLDPKVLEVQQPRPG